MKTTLLIWMLACVSVWAQSTATDLNGVDQQARDAALRRAMRAALLGETNAPATSATLAANSNPGGAVSNNPGVPPRPANAASATPLPLPPNVKRPPFNPAAFARGTNGNNHGIPGAVPTPGAASATPVVPNPFVPGPNAAPKPPEQTFAAGTIDFPAAPLDVVLEVYAELVNRTILHANLPQVQISLHTQTALTRTEAIQALNSVLAMNGITMVPVGDKFVKAVQKPEVFQTAPQFTTNLNGLTEGDEYITHIVQLKYVKPSEMAAVLVPFSQIPNAVMPIDASDILIIRDYASNVKRMMELIKQVDVTVQPDYDEEVIPIKYAKASDIASALSSLGGNTGTTIGHSSSSGHTGTMGGFGNSMGMGTGMNPGGAMGTGTYGGMNGGSTQPSTPMSGRSSSFTDRLNNIVKKAAAQGEFQVLGQTKIIADERTNSLLVFAGKADMKMIKDIVSKLDVVLAQVLIESIIMEVSLDNSHSLGFSYLQNSPTSAGKNGYFSGLSGLNNGTLLNKGSFTSVGSNAPSIPSGFSYWANFGNDFQATMTAIAADSRIHVLSRPRVQTSHGVTATIQVGQQVPMITGTYFGGISGVGSSSQYQLQFVGINLQVTPLINPDGLVVMDIQQQVAQLGPNYTIDGNQVPSTTTRNAQATVSVKDRDTIILGGMISSTKNKSNSGIPLLKDIPGLGALFRSSSSDDQRVELIVLIRPTVLPTPEAAALVAAHERARLPGVKAAEAEERRDEQQRLKAAEKIKVPDENY